MKCPRCFADVSEDSLFCNSCGSSLDEDTAVDTNTDNSDMTATMKIPVVKQSDVYTKDTVEEAPKQVVYERMPEKSVKAKPQKQNGILVFFIVFLITVVIGLSAVLAIVLLGNQDKEAKNDVQTPVSDAPAVQDEPSVKEPEIVVPEEGESEGIEEKTEIVVDTAFEFSSDVEFDVPEDNPKTLSSAEYGYECAIPSDFVFVSEAGGEIRYKAKNQTAYMDIGVCANSRMQDESSLKNMICAKLGTAGEFSETYDGYFVLRCVKDSVVYNYKCYVDDYVRYIEFVYPKEYSGIYEDYYTHLAESFVKTN